METKSFEERIGAIFAKADGGCPGCVLSLAVDFVREFPETSVDLLLDGIFANHSYIDKDEFRKDLKNATSGGVNYTSNLDTDAGSIGWKPYADTAVSSPFDATQLYPNLMPGIYTVSVNGETRTVKCSTSKELNDAVEAILKEQNAANKQESK